MWNIAIRLPTPSGLFQLAVPTKIQFLPSDHLSPLFGKLPGCLLASLVKCLSVLYLILILCALMLAFILTAGSFGLRDHLHYLLHLILIKLSSSQFLSLEFCSHIYANPSDLLKLFPFRVELMKCISLSKLTI